MINFRDFVWVLGVMCRGELIERLKYLYRLHLPPALLPSDTDESEYETTKSGRSSGDFCMAFGDSINMNYIRHMFVASSKSVTKAN